ncbi:MAG: hypothetical protein ACFFD2_08415 [Promethearchaeota archaeon]
MALDIYLISTGGLNLFSYKSKINTENECISDHFLSGIIFTVVKAIKCITNPDLNVEIIDLGKLQLHFRYGINVWGILITNNKTPHIQDKLEILISQFEEKYKDILKDWNGNRSKFDGAKILIEKIFG